eukprot:TRINITY_DN24557_c0_g2_i2.p1 TRINITY_DN24557_c0_g2~~TRINITY_DN24557_c0_g2_i2.p1  ORF type:complete len:117 (+),score=28.11 TRINITY_DN24557_c0_g2_i2:59-409(+)
MLRSLVGSEMCIRDRVSTQSTGNDPRADAATSGPEPTWHGGRSAMTKETGAVGCAAEEGELEPEAEGCAAACARVRRFVVAPEMGTERGQQGARCAATLELSQACLLYTSPSPRDS